jgi:hypothetical protein
MKKMIFGTVSAVALLIAVHGVGNADTSTSSNVSDNDAIATVVHNRNSVGDAFGGAEGAIQSQQNASINSATSQNMSITASVGGHGSSRADADTRSRVRYNEAAFDKVDSRNSVGDDSFNHAEGAIQVQQNASINSSATQNTAISASVFGSGRTANDADLSAQVTRNSAYFVAVTGPNTISDAFERARGAISVQQNNSVNSAVNQQLSIAASIR